MGWSLPYTHAVLGPWKMSAFYSRAVLDHDQRIALDGSPAEAVDAEARALATQQLAKLAARSAAKAAPPPPVTAKPKPKAKAPKPAASTDSADLRDRVRASVSRVSRSARTQNGKVVSTSASYTFNMPSANVTLTAHFK
jgi:sRNA-binding protein